MTYPLDQPAYRLPRGVRSAWSNIHNVGGEAGRAGVAVRVPRVEPGRRSSVSD